MLTLTSLECGKYTWKERVFFAVSYMPKSSNVATLASVVLIQARTLGDTYQDYQHYGLII